MAFTTRNGLASDDQVERSFFYQAERFELIQFTDEIRPELGPLSCSIAYQSLVGIHVKGMDPPPPHA